MIDNIDEIRFKESIELLNESFKRMTESINRYCREMEREIDRLQIERLKRNERTL